MRTFFVFLFLTAGAFGQLRVSSPDFGPGEFIPRKFTCQGENVAPVLQISGVPGAAKSLVLIVEDPDAPSGVFTHWLVWNIPPGSKTLPSAGALQGTNDFGNVGYSGPCPPEGVHRYFFRLYAMDMPVRLRAGASRKELDAAMQGHVIGKGSLMGRYGGKSSQ